MACAVLLWLVLAAQAAHPAVLLLAWQPRRIAAASPPWAAGRLAPASGTCPSFCWCVVGWLATVTLVVCCGADCCQLEGAPRSYRRPTPGTLPPLPPCKPLRQTLVPFLRSKLDALHQQLQTQQQQQSVRHEQHAAALGEQAGGSLAAAQRRLQAAAFRIFLLLYPWAAAAHEGARFAYQLLYLLGRTPYYSPGLHLLGLQVGLAGMLGLRPTCGWLLLHCHYLLRPTLFGSRIERSSSLDSLCAGGAADGAGGGKSRASGTIQCLIGQS